MKVDPNKNGKDNVLVMTDAFYNISVPVITPNQEVKSIAKTLVDKWFYTHRIPPRIHSEWDKILAN